MKVLVSAYACEPDAGSEPGAGWAWARGAAVDHDVWLLTRRNNADKIEAACALEPQLRLQPIYLDLPRWARGWKRGQRGVRTYYLLWQVLARRVARRLHRMHGFDVAHHITFGTDWMPAGVVGIPGLPAVWGPVGGATGTPWSLWRWLGWRGVVSEASREITSRVMRRLFGERAARGARLIVAQNQDVARRFHRHGPIVLEPNIALDTAALRAVTEDAGRRPSNGRRRAVFVGRLIPWKGLRLAVAALAEPPAAEWELHAYGDGPERGAVTALAQRAGVTDRVVLHGQRPRTEVLRAVAGADAFLFPSMHDSAGWAVGEAVTLGVSVICLDRAGPPLAAAGYGEAVAPRGRRTVSDLAEALGSASEPGLGTDRWSADRLPDLLTDWYERASEGSDESAV